MRVVLDTNVLVSATFWSGASFKIMEFIDNGKIDLVLSKAILEEYDKVIHSDEILEKVDTLTQFAIAAIVQKIILKAKLVEPKVKLNIIKDDLDDNKIIEAAVEGQAYFIISQDHHLTDLISYDNIQILKPEDFLKLLKK